MTSRLEELLHKRKLFRTRDLVAEGVTPRQIARAVEDGLLVRPTMIEERGPLSGIYAAPETAEDPWRDDCIAMLLTGGVGVIGKQYAGMWHGITTSVSRPIDVIVPHGFPEITPRAKVHLHRSRRPESLTVGIDTIETDLGIPIRITSKARTVIDLFRMRTGNSDDWRHGVEALAAFIEEGGLVAEVIELSGHFEAWLPEAVEIACNAASETHTRRFGA